MNTNTNTINKEELFQLAIDNIKNEIDIIPYVNRGGCGVVAKEIYNLFLKLGYKPKITLFSNYPVSIAEYANNNYNCPKFDHIVIKVGKYYIDSTGAYTTKKQMSYNKNKKVYVGLPFDKLLDLIDNNDVGWNWLFNRYKYEPIIERKCRKIYKVLDEHINSCL